MATKPSNRAFDTLSLALGALLIVLGILFLIGQFIDFNVDSFAWPFFVIVPGVLLFIFALTLKNGLGEALAVLGSMATVTGLLLFYQNITDHWESWSYAWALVAPTAAGVGQLFYGTFHGRTQMVRTGLYIAGVGLIFFLAGAAFFELVIGISGFGLGTAGWSLVLIGLGVIVLLRPFFFRLRRVRYK